MPERATEELELTPFWLETVPLVQLSGVQMR